MKKPTKIKKQKVDGDADNGDSKRKVSKQSNTKNQHAAGSEDEDALTPNPLKVSAAVNSEKGLDGEETAEGDCEEESKDKKMKKRKKDRVAAPEEDELTPKKKAKKAKEKVFDLPGQKRPPPDERDPSRIFYETLYRQVPDCELAQIWMMESGLLQVEEAKKVYKKKRNKTLSSPLPADAVADEKSLTVQVKPSFPPVSSSKKKRSEATVTLKKKSNKSNEDRT